MQSGAAQAGHMLSSDELNSAKAPLAAAKLLDSADSDIPSKVSVKL